MLKKEFGAPIPAKVEKVPGCPVTQPQYTITFDKPRKDVKYVVLAEDIAQGQRVETFRITRNHEKIACFEGTCIGHKRICPLWDPFANQNPLTDDSAPEIEKLTVHITAARDEVLMKDILVY